MEYKQLEEELHKAFQNLEPNNEGRVEVRKVIQQLEEFKFDSGCELQSIFKDIEEKGLTDFDYSTFSSTIKSRYTDKKTFQGCKRIFDILRETYDEKGNKLSLRTLEIFKTDLGEFGNASTKQLEELIVSAQNSDGIELDDFYRILR